MKNSHLSTARLLAIRDGDTTDIPAMEHLVSCARCQRAFDDSRWLTLLGRLRRQVPSGTHPDSDELIAYRAQALSPSRLAEVGRHLSSCERCLAAFGHERLADRALGYSSPSPRAVAQVRNRFRPQLRQLGTVLVRRFKERLAVFFVPDPDVIGAASGPPRAAAMEPEQLEMTQEAVDVSFVEDRIEDAYDPMPRMAESRSFAAPGGVALIRSGNYSLVLEPSPGADAPSLTLTLSSADSAAVVDGIRIESAPRKGQASVARTGPDGNATLPLTPGRFEIAVHAAPPFRFRLEFPD